MRKGLGVRLGGSRLDQGTASAGAPTGRRAPPWGPALRWSWLAAVALAGGLGAPAAGCSGEPTPPDASARDAAPDRRDAAPDRRDAAPDDGGNAPFVIALEPEDGRGVGDLDAHGEPSVDPACGDGWVEAPGSAEPFVWDPESPSLPEHRRELDVELPAPGTYHVWVRMASSSPDEDALYVGFEADDLRRVYPPDDYAYDGSWVWVDGVDGDAARLRFEGLSAGAHTLVVGHGEPGARVDRVVIASSREADFERSCGPCAPACTGRACGPDGCGGECGSCASGQRCTSEGVCEDAGATHEALLDRRVGFARNVTGGAGGEVCWVENLNDDGDGSLRACAEAEGPRWIRFAVSGTIVTDTPRIAVTSHKTIDGRGQNVVLTGSGLGLLEVENVIVHDIRISGASGPGRDGMSIARGSHDVWIDHVSFDDFTDGLLDITLGATDVTVSWCHFSNHDKVMLIGADVADTGDADIRVTLHHNFFEGTNQRHPRLRYGRVHAFNNLLERWGHYGMASSQNGQLLSENNVFVADGDTRAVVPQAGSDPDQGYVRSSGDLLLGGAEVTEREPGVVFDPRDHYDYTAEAADESLRARIREGAGQQG